jgi:hypothetical protein
MYYRGGSRREGLLCRHEAKFKPQKEQTKKKKKIA